MPRPEYCPDSPNHAHHWREDVFDGRRKELVVRRTRRRFGRMVCIYCGADYDEFERLKRKRPRVGIGPDISMW